MAKRNLLYGGTVPMEPGQRDQAVTIQQKADSTGTSGFPTETWSMLATPVWMRKLDLRASEQFGANQLSAKADAMWEMCYRADMDPDLVDVSNLRRLVFKGRTYDITSGSLIGLKEGIELSTLAKVG